MISYIFVIVNKIHQTKSPFLIVFDFLSHVAPRQFVLDKDQKIQVTNIYIFLKIGQNKTLKMLCAVVLLQVLLKHELVEYLLGTIFSCGLMHPCALLWIFKAGG